MRYPSCNQPLCSRNRLVFTNILATLEKPSPPLKAAVEERCRSTAGSALSHLHIC